MTGIIKTDQIQGAQGTTVTVPTGNTLAVTSNATVGGTLGVTGNQTNSGNLTVSGAFTSQGIDDNADAVAITIDNSEKVAIGSTSVDGDASVMFLNGTDPSDVEKGQLVLKGTATSGAADTGAGLTFKGHNGSGNRGFGSIQVLKQNGTSGNNDSFMRFATRSNSNGYQENVRIDASGHTLFGVTSNPVSQSGTTTSGHFLGRNTYTAFSKVGGVVSYFNRQYSDGNVIAIRQDGSDVGFISVSGTTTSYGAFSGSHWSRLTDNSKPTILRGTVVETIDEMCDWYQAKITIPKTDDNNERIIKDSISLPKGKKVGDTISHTYEDVTYDNAVIIKEEDNKHTKCKISDTADSKRVYGVFTDWDNDDDTVNDMYVTACGTHVVRINKDVTVQAGDLLSSNGDGTAKVQDDDIIRSKTIGKVLTNIKQETYDDGSYTVPCALYCG